MFPVVVAIVKTAQVTAFAIVKLKTTLLNRQNLLGKVQASFIL